MKLISKLFLGATTLAVAGAFTSCKEENTLGGADAVYLELANSGLTLLVGEGHGKKAVFRHRGCIVGR